MELPCRSRETSLFNDRDKRLKVRESLHLNSLGYWKSKSHFVTILSDLLRVNVTRAKTCDFKADDGR